ncbi:unnamed protein product [Candidula unifasciata]|uniref:G-protein coupled receptors family 1 profile domain-containing protein n=1 Tax=Candidula unifasciata TaxID=100452 RepID=A0A8S3ZWQ5_9EUPU|nr:unnamed protein product [Candidula unifasciata]
MITTSSIGIRNVTFIKDDKALISDEMVSYFTLVNTCIIGHSVTIIGLVVNVLNIIVFIRQGLQDSVTISLLGLSVSDLGSLFFSFFANLCWTPPIPMMDLPFYPLQLMYFLVWTHVVFTRVTTGITAWITFERCLCIVVPLKIKSIITPRRTVTFIGVLYVIMFASAVPVFYSTRAVWIFDPRRNKSRLGIMKITSKIDINTIAYWINNVIPTIFFVFITICTVILVKALNKHGKWKQQSVSSEAHAVISSRDAKVVKLVTIISIVFIACYAPGTVYFILALVNPQTTYAGKQRNLVLVIYSILLVLESVNAATNFFIYITMSSKFKRVFQDIFCAFCYVEEKGKESSAQIMVTE